jgi:hypothetical protein
MNAKEYRGRQWQILLFGDQPIRDRTILPPMAQKRNPDTASSIGVKSIKVPGLIVSRKKQSRQHFYMLAA